MWMVDVAMPGAGPTIGDMLRVAANSSGELISYDTPETHFASREAAEKAAEITRRLHPDCAVEVNRKSY